MLCGFTAVMQASGFECLVFDPFSFQQNGLASAEVDISGCEVGDAFVVTKMVVVADEVMRQRLAQGHPLRVAILWAAVPPAMRRCGGS